MADADREELIAIARAIAARAPVDWTAIESTAGDDSVRAAIREFQVIAGIANLHHTLGTVSSAARPDSSASSPAPHPERTGRSSAAAADVPATMWGGFALLEQLGHGTYGDVYRAWDGRLEREVALKLLRRSDTPDDSVGSTVIEEGRLLARVRHPNVVTVYGADRVDNRVGVWMELVRG